MESEKENSLWTSNGGASALLIKREAVAQDRASHAHSPFVGKEKLSAHSLFLDSEEEEEEEESSFHGLVKQCMALQQRSDELVGDNVRHHDDTSLHSELFGSLHAEANDVSRKLPSRPNPLSREQTQLHRLLGDYMLTAKGDRIMDAMEAVLREDDHETGESTTSELLSTENAQDDAFDLSEFLDSMADFEQYIAEKDVAQ